MAKRVIEEPNWTSVPNALFELLPDLTNADVKVALVIIRETRGWHKKSVTMSMSEIGKCTGLSPGSCCDAATRLCDLGVLKKTKHLSDKGGLAATSYELDVYPTPIRPAEYPIRPTEDPLFGQPNAYKEERKQEEIKEQEPPTPSEPTQILDADAFLRESDKLRGKHYSGRQKKHIPDIWKVEWCELAFESVVPLVDRELGKGAKSTSAPRDRSPQRAVVRPRQIGVVDLVEMPTWDYVGQWNATVPECPTEWNAKYSPMADLRRCAADPDFCARFAEVCESAHKAHASRGADVAWLTFEWVIREKDGIVGWWRLLTDMKWATMPKPKTKAEEREDIWARI